MAREAWVVVDLGFGDAGKGSLTDFLVRERQAGLVVRFNGGAQAGHNVVTPDGRHHTFSQLGAGSFVPAVQTLLGPAFLLHPGGLAVEEAHLGVEGALERTAVHAEARLITPYHQAGCRIRELLRGERAHGTCGVGVGECVADSLAHPGETLRAADLDDPDRLVSVLRAQRARKSAELAGLEGRWSEAAHGELSLFADDGVIDRVVASWRDLYPRLWIVDERQASALISGTPRVVFEGAQGVLLDEDWGFHPHTTWSDCTFRGALELLGDDRRRLVRLGVTRAYTVRHGPGPFPTEGLFCAPEDHNDDAGWQGPVRTGALDGVLLRYARAVAGGVDAVALTCLDRVPEPAPVCVAYRVPSGARLDALEPGIPGDLAHRQALGELLRAVDPVVEHRDVVELVERLVGAPVLIESHGPTAADKTWRARW